MAIIKYGCDQCGEVHRSRYDAEECCQPAVNELYFCDICDTEHDSEAEANECCSEEREQADPLRPTASKWELEAAGQGRLL